MKKSKPDAQQLEVLQGLAAQMEGVFCPCLTFEENRIEYFPFLLLPRLLLLENAVSLHTLCAREVNKVKQHGR